MSKSPVELGLSPGQVRLCEPTSRWAALFDEEAYRLAAALASLDATVEHCGSTSIAGIPAKPILDILVGIAGKVYRSFA